MKVKLNSLLDDASGKFGDNVFARNPSGLYLRKHVEPDQPNSERQMSVRDRFSLFASRWASLTEDQRVGWNGLAAQITKTGKYGDLYNPTGHRLYIALNATRGEFALAELDDAPITIEPTIPLAGFAPTVHVTAAPAVELKLGAAATALTSKLLVYATEPMSAGRSVIPDASFRLIATADAADLLNANIGAFYDDKFGIPAGGVKIGVKVIPVSESGFQGNTQSSLVIVTA
jgi:nucleoid-associated protein YgaU